MKPVKFSNRKLWIAPALLVLIVLALFSTAGVTQSQPAAKLLLEPAIDMPTIESEHPYANNFDDFGPSKWSALRPHASTSPASSWRKTPII